MQQVTQDLQRHARGEASVVPVMLRPVDIEELVLQGITPEDVRAVRPELGDYRFGRSETGIQALADELVDAIRVPPRAEPRPFWWPPARNTSPLAFA